MTLSDALKTYIGSDPQTVSAARRIMDAARVDIGEAKLRMRQQHYRRGYGGPEYPAEIVAQFVRINADLNRINDKDMDLQRGDRPGGF